MTSPLPVAFDMTFPNRNPAGSGVYANELLGALILRQDLSVTTVAAPDAGGFGTTMRWLTSGARRATTGAEVVHCPSFVAPWRIDAPVVITVHDMSTQKFPQDHPLEWRTYTRWFLPERARAAAFVITGTEHARREIVSELGLPPDRVVVTPYGVAARFFARVVKRETIADPPLMLFPGAPTRRKNLDLVIRAMAEAPATSIVRRARLAISGAAAERFPQHVERIRSLGLRDRVEWLGKVAVDAMPGLVGSADLVVYPSLHEGFGFPALEAMASGTPVLASNAACLPEVLGDGAWLVEPTDLGAFIDAAETLFTDAGVRCAQVDRGTARAARFTWERCAELTAEVYRQAAAGGSRGGDERR